MLPRRIFIGRKIRQDTRNPNRSWRVDETYVRVGGHWTYRAVDSTGETIDFQLSPKRDDVDARKRSDLLRAGLLTPPSN